MRTNKLYLGLRTGLNYNIETYFDPTLDKNSMEVNLETGVSRQLNDDYNKDTLINIENIYPLEMKII